MCDCSKLGIPCCHISMARRRECSHFHRSMAKTDMPGISNPSLLNSSPKRQLWCGAVKSFLGSRRGFSEILTGICQVGPCNRKGRTKAQGGPVLRKNDDFYIARNIYDWPFFNAYVCLILIDNFKIPQSKLKR